MRTCLMTSNPPSSGVKGGRCRSVVFFNYRREDPDGHAERLFRELVKRFGGHKIFMDNDIPLGVDFTQEIAKRLRSCRALLVIVGPN